MTRWCQRQCRSQVDHALAAVTEYVQKARFEIRTPGQAEARADRGVKLPRTMPGFDKADGPILIYHGCGRHGVPTIGVLATNTLTFGDVLAGD